MSVKILFEYIKVCKVKKVNPTKSGLYKYKHGIFS